VKARRKRWVRRVVSIGEKKFLPVSDVESSIIEIISKTQALVDKRIILKLILKTYWKGTVWIDLIRNMEIVDGCF
jgi:hypothetical protein